MNPTKIEWVKNPDGTQGYTWNPCSGCLNHVSGKCKGGNFPCYAYKLAHTRLKYHYLNGKQQLPMIDNPDNPEYVKAIFDPFYPRFWPEKLTEINSKQKPRGIFVCSMSDLFGIGVPEEWTRKVLDNIKQCPQHRFYLLTKQPQNLKKFSPFPDNCWVGVTATDFTRYGYMLDSGFQDIKASVKFVSFEPLLTRINVAERLDNISWVIIGAQTKPNVYPKIEWVQEIVEACDKAGVKVFLKNNLEPLVFERLLFAEGLVKWAGELRQEMPK